MLFVKAPNPWNCASGLAYVSVLGMLLGGVQLRKSEASENLVVHLPQHT